MTSMERLSDLLDAHLAGPSGSAVSAELLADLQKRDKMANNELDVEAALARAGAGQKKKPPWTSVEQAVVAIKHAELGNRWTSIAAFLPSRSENDVKVG
ncbi:hypothetical protein TSOC_011013 [Tetrabaena socialis]|uniref:Uncharacterized protein n=1 Tax=Tetrabaena socialis TaxID=47790 RepID=A0A2J7ZRS1_9CHLO|nr:hypothetical protein TSOC_011013 [Tetrabaena socialis]|eukprot:PNH02966.1 hypothetical protein TSOC_011013 [Tetrabaena socialis]